MAKIAAPVSIARQFVSDVRAFCDQNGVGDGVCSEVVEYWEGTYAWDILEYSKLLKPPRWSFCCMEVRLVDVVHAIGADERDEFFE